ncbi:alpha/beta hydrolase [Streptomyces violarus]|uniref:Pimeloyl-ACP methyl ester carboxylesterase n=1 Tax=Streptomyces violarus TaxID=67380 RepID=A0A7W4ZYZ6_9ACTN|nr:MULTISPECIES: alpha/beta hydrolase [Streptomyces]MBB3081117.1 pimeloyl-ACP methyl ester carboxylesterase [Streptomyces violarus]WRU02774.1 alpha/beta hydrolase [Streptomyces sp. CGMCC 4.1772]
MRGTRPKRRVTALGSAGALVTATLIAGAVAAPSANASAGTRHGQDREARGAAVAAARAAKAGIDWQDCPADWNLAKPIQCGYVTVPLDYAKPHGKQIKLAVDRIGNTGTKGERQGALLYNPGGPGGSGLRFPARVTSKNPVWANAAKAYDFVGFDPRGVGKSAPISCVDPQEFVKAPKMDPVPDSEADKLAQRKLAREYAEGCHDRSGAMLPHMTTPNTARDLDVIRAALGEKKLNFLGVSYGTYLGAVYGTLFPGHVRRMVVDSVVNPSRDKIWYQANLDQDVAFEGRWKDWQDWVAANDATYHLGTTRAAVQEKWLQLRASAKKNPLGGVVGPAELISFFQSAPYYDSSWAPVASVFSKYVAGDTQALVDAAAPDLADTAGNASAENGNAVYTAVECADAKWPTSWRTWDRDNTRLHKDHPFMTWANAWMNLPCATWPAKQRTPLNVKSGKGLPGVLIVQSEHDAATPYEGAVELHKRFKGSRLITEKDAGSHGVTGLVNPCVNERVDSYLLTGELGRRDVTCAPHAKPKP